MLILNNVNIEGKIRALHNLNTLYVDIKQNVVKLNIWSLRYLNTLYVDIKPARPFDFNYQRNAI